MQNNTDVIAGLASSIFQDNETKFAKEQNFGRKLFIAAWAVEIMAASLGLLIAGFVAYDAYSQNPDESGNGLLNAITGALPFALIAVIELTKIPLASGLYRVRNWAWKIFILIALLALMLVTFETMFTGLERQMTNITARITDKKTAIQRFESQISENERQISEITKRDVESETDDINQQILTARSDAEQQLLNLNESHNSVVADLEQQLKDLSEQQLKSQNLVTSNFDTSIKLANERITSSNQKLEEAEKRVEQILAKIDDDPDIKKLERDNVDIQRLMDETEDLLASPEEANVKRAQVRINVKADGKRGIFTRSAFNNWREGQEDQIAANDLAIDNIKDELKGDLDRAEANVLKIVNERDTWIGERQSFEEQKTNVIRALADKPPSLELQLIGQQITEVQSKLQVAKDQYFKREEGIRSQEKNTVKSLTDQRREISDNINSERQLIPELKSGITKLKENIVTIQNEIRKDARNNQVYRFAQKWGQRSGSKLFDREAYEDILDVTEKDITKVGAFWFGSIAIICATIGTVLALIANIMTDPDAFVQKQKSRKVRPVRRGLRLLFLVVRKKLLKRREVIEREKIVEIEKLVEVEKEVEKIVEVEKIIEIEKEVEKEVEKLVPEIIPIPIFIPSDADHEAEMGKASKYYDAINKTIDDAVKRSSE